MNLGIVNALANMNITLETIVLIIFLFGSLIFFARSFLIGTMLLFFGSVLIFLWFYNTGMNFVPMVIVFLISLVMMTLSLYSISRQSLEGGVI